LLGRDSLASHGSIDAHATFTGLAPRTATATAFITGRGALDRVRLDSLVARLRLDRGVVTLDTLLAHSNVGTASGSGHVAWFDTTAAERSDLHVAVAVTNARPLRRLVTADTLALGSATFRPARRRHGASAPHRDPWHGALAGVEPAAAARRRAGGHRYARSRLPPRRRQADASIRRLEGAGLPIRDGTVRATAERGATAFELRAAIDDRHSAHVVGRTAADSAVTRLTLATLEVQADSTAWALVRPARIELARTRFVVDDFEVRSPGGELTARGVIDRRGTQDFHLVARNVGIDVLSALVGREDLRGSLSATSISRTGGRAARQWRAPAGARDRRWAGGHAAVRARVGRHAPRRARRVRRSQGGLDRLERAPAAGALARRARLGVRDARRRRRRRHACRGDALPLAALSPLLDPRAVGTLGGTLDLDLRLQGSSRSLVGAGRVDVTGGTVPLPALAVTYQNIAVRGAFDGNRLVVQQAHAGVRQGHARRHG
jgi:hypothetical protein